MTLQPYRPPVVRMPTPEPIRCRDCGEARFPCRCERRRNRITIAAALAVIAIITALAVGLLP